MVQLLTVGIFYIFVTFYLNELNHVLWRYIERPLLDNNNAMDDRLKSLLYMGVGLASTSRKAQLLLEKMELEGKLSEEEGRRIVGEIIEGVKSEGSHLKDDAYKYLHDILNEVDTPSKREFNELKERVAKLEALLKEKGTYDI